MSILNVTERELPRARNYLRRDVETSMFLLSNLEGHGFRLSDAMSSGNLKCLCDGNQIQAVFCQMRRGNILAESGGRREFAAAIVEACIEDAIRIGGVVGEWRLADAIWHQLLQKDVIERVIFASREPLYRLQLDRHERSAALTGWTHSGQ